MKIIQRAYAGAVDQQPTMALAHVRPADNLHVVDQPYRFSSWALDEPDNVQLWVDEQEQVVAWVVMQTPFWSIDYACHPSVSDEVHPQLLAWADQRARQLPLPAAVRAVHLHQGDPGGRLVPRARDGHDG